MLWLVASESNGSYDESAVIDFLGFMPSAVAAAAVLSAAGEDSESPVEFHERVNKVR